MSAAESAAAGDANAVVGVAFGAVRVAVLGGTGAIGRHVIRCALASPGVAHITALVRRAQSVSPNVKLTERVVNFSEAGALDGLFADTQTVFCAMGSTIKAAGSEAEFFKQDHDVIVNAATAAKAQGVEQFVLVSSVGASDRVSNFYLKTKGQIETELKALKFDRLTIYKPSVLEADRESSRCGERCGLCCIKCCSPCVGCCCAQYGSIRVSEVAHAMVDGSLGPASALKVYDGSQQIHEYLRTRPPEDQAMQ